MFFRGLRLNSWMERSLENTTSTQGTKKQTSLSPTGIPTTEKLCDIFLIFSYPHAVCIGFFIIQESDVCEGDRFDWTFQ